jgi:copper homeostasis protein (lipoprotein)
MKTAMLIVTLTAAVLGGCASAPPAGPPVADATAVITERYWKLVELNGQPVPALPREVHMVLRAQGGRVNGFGGCNSFSGAYVLDAAASRIRFDQLASTRMACMGGGMEVETAFHQVLNSIDNYALNGDRLTLNRARMAPLARFEAVYLP